MEIDSRLHREREQIRMLEARLQEMRSQTGRGQVRSFFLAGPFLSAHTQGCDREGVLCRDAGRLEEGN